MAICEKNVDQPEREDDPFSRTLIDKLNDPDIQAALESLISYHSSNPSGSCPPLGVYTQAETTLDRRHTGASSLPVGYRFHTDQSPVSSSSIESQPQSPSTDLLRHPLADVPLSYLLNAEVELTQKALQPLQQFYAGTFGVVTSIDDLQSNWVCIYVHHSTAPAKICISSTQAAMLKVLPPMPGDKVRVIRGQFASFEGTLSSQHDNQQAVVEFCDGSLAVLFLKDLVRLRVHVQGDQIYNQIQSPTCTTGNISQQDPRTHSNVHTLSPNSNSRPTTLLPSCDWPGNSPICSPMTAYNGMSDTSPASSHVDQRSSSMSPGNPWSVCSPSDPVLFNPSCTLTNNTSLHDPTLSLQDPGMSTNGSLHNLTTSSNASPYNPRMISTTVPCDPRTSSNTLLYDPSNTSLHDPRISTNSSLYDPTSSTTSGFEPISTFLSRPTFVYNSVTGYQRRESISSDTSDLTSQVSSESCPPSQTTYSTFPSPYSSTQSYSTFCSNPSQFSNRYGMPFPSTYGYSNCRPQYQYGLNQHNMITWQAAAFAYPNGCTYAQPRSSYNYLGYPLQQPPPYTTTLNQTGQTCLSPTSIPLPTQHNLCPRSNRLSSQRSTGTCNKDGLKPSTQLKDNPWEELKALITASKQKDLFCQRMYPGSCRSKVLSLDVVVEKFIEVLLTKEPPVHWYNPLTKEDNDDSESDLSTESIRVSVLCPLTKQKMEYPCRGLHCTHLQCFDANAFLQLALKRRCQSVSVKPVSSSSHLDNGWKCPVCGKVVCPKQIFIEKYFKKSIDTCEAMELEFRGMGKWEPIEKNVIKSSVIDLTMESDDEG